MNIINRVGLLFFMQIGFYAALMGQATKSTTHSTQIWSGYFNQTRFTDKWGMWSDIHLRTKEAFVNDFSQFIARVGLTYYLNDKTRATAGYAYINHFPADDHKHISMPEHRLWQQFQWYVSYPKLRTMQWLRLEERYRRKVLNDSELADGYNFNLRIRYNLMLQVPLSKRGPVANTFSFVLNNELHINIGKKIVYNHFDQNRLFGGFAWHIGKHDNLQFGYMNLYQQLPAGNRFRSIHTARIFYFHNPDLRKKKN